MVDTDVVVSEEIGYDQRMIGMTILGNYYAIIVTLKRAEENGVVLRGLRGPPRVTDGGYRCCGQG